MPFRSILPWQIPALPARKAGLVQQSQGDCASAVSHGHLDHVGALPKLLQMYPDLKVVIHEAESEHLTGLEGYFYKQDQSAQLKFLTWIKLLPASEFKVMPLPACTYGQSKWNGVEACTYRRDEHNFLVEWLSRCSLRISGFEFNFNKVCCVVYEATERGRKGFGLAMSEKLDFAPAASCSDC